MYFEPPGFDGVLNSFTSLKSAQGQSDFQNVLNISCPRELCQHLLDARFKTVQRIKTQWGILDLEFLNNIYNILFMKFARSVAHQRQEYLLSVNLQDVYLHIRISLPILYCVLFAV